MRFRSAPRSGDVSKELTVNIVGYSSSTAIIEGFKPAYIFLFLDVFSIEIY